MGQDDPDRCSTRTAARSRREHVYLYALRHSYAQRHADAGVPLDTLQKLMDHRTTATTQIYYRVTWARKREAIERVAPLTMDRDGRRVGFHASLVESERLREEIGRIPVPLGYCTEQHNVRALGAHCPFSHQCLGCEHFRTDPSHLPDLYAYLERLLETRERLRAAVPQLAEWARDESDPRRRGDPHRSHPDPRRRGRARRARRPASDPSCLSCSACCARPAHGWTARSRSSRSPRPATPSRRSLPPAFTPLPSVRAAGGTGAA